MVGVLGHQHMGEQTCGGQPLVDDVCIYRGLSERLAARAGPLAPHKAVDREDARGVVELLGHILANALHRLATAIGRCGLMEQFPAGQLRGQGLTLGLLAGCPLGCGLPCVTHLLDLDSHRLQILIEGILEQAALLSAESLAPGGELHALEHGVLEGELVEQRLLVTQLGGLLLELAHQAQHQLARALVHALQIHRFVHACDHDRCQWLCPLAHSRIEPRCLPVQDHSTVMTPACPRRCQGRPVTRACNCSWLSGSRFVLELPQMKRP